MGVASLEWQLHWSATLFVEPFQFTPVTLLVVEKHFVENGDRRRAVYDGAEETRVERTYVLVFCKEQPNDIPVTIFYPLDGDDVALLWPVYDWRSRHTVRAKFPFAIFDTTHLLTDSEAHDSLAEIAGATWERGLVVAPFERRGTLDLEMSAALSSHPCAANRLNLRTPPSSVEVELGAASFFVSRAASDILERSRSGRLEAEWVPVTAGGTVTGGALGRRCAI